ncbi:AAA family ATPase [Cardinium endosymbiont of Culicoides punctatus]|uniref:AAA family ATPase n=1 Tax=Cardinium endosymbiont of Culicoides punctatus TaxID=2304601 RepID=UPI00140492C5|nr:AAA family ATPase [Cardinium endosymbiont of Culicoides punctatus]
MHQDPKDLANKRPLEEVEIGSDSKKKKLGSNNIPIGVVSIEEMLSTQYYVDKTDHAYTLMSGVNKYIFLSRPRRFGKSLFVSTLEEIAKGNKELFQDCYIYNSGYDWKKYPVIRVDFSNIDKNNSKVLKESILNELYTISNSYEIAMEKPNKKTLPNTYLKDLINKLVSKYTELKKTDSSYEPKVVVLVDEYDSPFINQSDPVIKEENRLIVREFLTVIKSLTANNFIKLEFVTGVSAYCFRDTYSGPNNLNDITLDKNYATIAGYKEEDLLQKDSIYSKKVNKLAKKRNISSNVLVGEMRSMYNGYKFHPEDDTIAVYNPLSTLMFLQRGELNNYWINTGTPTFLVKKAGKSNTKDFSKPISVTKHELTEPDEDNLTVNGAMFQGGYLTIDKYENPLDNGKLRQMDDPILLKFPNGEVEKSFYNLLFKKFEKDLESEGKTRKRAIVKKLKDIDLEGLVKVIRSCMSSIPFNLSHPKHNKNEAYYHTALHCLLEGAELNPLSEHATSGGRIDIVIDALNDVTYIFELKHDQNVNIALGQIEGNNYREKFLYKEKNIVLIGLNYASKMRNVEQKFDFAIYDEDGNKTTKDAILGNRQHVRGREVNRQRG